MSAPDTNLEKQTKRHSPALAGMGIAAAFAAILFAGFLLIVAERGDAPDAEASVPAGVPAQAATDG